MLPVESGPKLAVGQWVPYGEQVWLGEIATGGNFICCLIIVVMFMGVGGAYRLEADFKVIIWGTSCEGMGLFFIGRVAPQGTM